MLLDISDLLKDSQTNERARPNNLLVGFIIFYIKGNYIMTEKTLEDLLDMQLDDLKDLPDFGVYPNGAHTATIHFARKDINGKDCIELKLKGIESMELVDSVNDKPITPKQEMSVLYDLGNEFGQGSLKKIVKSLAAGLNHEEKMSVLIEAEGVAVMVTTKKRVVIDKDTKETKEYGAISNLQVI